jgi:ubiquinone/menaquinone biosynthesis C-methylase UbiE
MMNDNFASRAADWDNPGKIEMTKKFVTEMLLQISLEPHWKAIEIGAGTGLVGLQIAPMLQTVVYEDTSEAMLNVLRNKLEEDSNAEILHGEIYDYKKQDIDFVFSFMAFHHIPDIEKTLSHLKTITKSDALVVLSDLVTEDGSFHGFEPIPHMGFDIHDLSHQFKEAGFEVLSAHSYNTITREREPGKLTDYDQFILVAKRK